MTYEDTMTYIESQFMKACPLPLNPNKNGMIVLKIHSEKGESNWLTVPPEKVNLIMDILNSEAVK
jgi:hypothetical protein